MSEPNWKTDAIRDRVAEFCAANTGANGNGAIKAMLEREFRVRLTPGQVAGAMHRWGIERGRHYFRKSATDEDMGYRACFPDILTVEAAGLERLRLYKQVSRHKDRAAYLAERHRAYERHRYAKAKAAREAHPAADAPRPDRSVTANRRAANPLMGSASAKAKMGRQSLAARTAPVIKSLPPVPSTVTDSQPAPIVFRTTMPLKRIIDCQWLDGNGPFTACSERSEPGKSFCEAHCRRVYLVPSGLCRDPLPSDAQQCLIVLRLSRIKRLMW